MQAKETRCLAVPGCWPAQCTSCCLPLLCLQALVDDISVAIIHMAPLGPVDRSAHVRSPLAHAASCNDEANALFRSWQFDGGRNPSNHAPQRFFQHLYQSAGGSSGGSGAAPQMPLRRQQSDGAVLCSAGSQGDVSEEQLELRERAMSLDEASGSHLRLAAAADEQQQLPQPRRRQDSSSSGGGGGRCSGQPSTLGSRLGAGASQQGPVLAERGSRRITIPSTGVQLPVSPFPAAAAAAASLAHQQQQQQRQQFVPAVLQPQHSLPSTVSSLDCSDSEHGHTRCAPPSGICPVFFFSCVLLPGSAAWLAAASAVVKFLIAFFVPVPCCFQAVGCKCWRQQVHRRLCAALFSPLGISTRRCPLRPHPLRTPTPQYGLLLPANPQGACGLQCAPVRCKWHM